MLILSSESSKSTHYAHIHNITQICFSKQVKKQNFCQCPSIYGPNCIQGKTEEGHSHVIGQVVFIKSVSLKAMRRCIKVVTSNATYEAFCLHKKTVVNVA